MEGVDIFRELKNLLNVALCWMTLVRLLNITIVIAIVKLVVKNSYSYFKV